MLFNNLQPGRRERERYRQTRTKELKEQYTQEGHPNPQQEAEQKVAEEMANLAATHTLDLVAGGDGSISGMGDRSINASIGSQ